MEYRAADFSYWDTVEWFTLTEAAWLWCDLEPPDDGVQHMPVLGKGIQPHPVIKGLPAKGGRAARAMWRDIAASKLVILTEWPDTRYLIPRVYLRAWAETYSVFRPRFLFQDAEKPKKPRISERETEHNKWRPYSAPASKPESTHVDLPESVRPKSGRREKQLSAFNAEIKARGWDKEIPYGGLEELKRLLCDSMPKLFTTEGFKHFCKWKNKQGK